MEAPERSKVVQRRAESTAGKAEAEAVPPPFWLHPDGNIFLDVIHSESIRLGMRPDLHTLYDLRVAPTALSTGLILPLFGGGPTTRAPGTLGPSMSRAVEQRAGCGRR